MWLSMVGCSAAHGRLPLVGHEAGLQGRWGRQRLWFQIALFDQRMLLAHRNH